MQITEAEFQHAIDAFCDETGFDLSARRIGILLYEHPADITTRDAERLARVKGLFLPTRNKVVMFACNLKDEKDIIETLRHELIVHYGLSLLRPLDKRHVLGVLLSTRANPAFASMWAPVNRYYGKQPALVQAEEALAFLAQNRHGPFERLWDRLVTLIAQGLRRVKILGPQPRSQREIHALVEDLALNIRRGIPQQPGHHPDAYVCRRAEPSHKLPGSAPSRSENPVQSTSPGWQCTDPV